MTVEELIKQLSGYDKNLTAYTQFDWDDNCYPTSDEKIELHPDGDRVVIKMK